MESDAYDQDALFCAIATSGARALLIGRQAMIVYGLPMVTADYDYWLHFDDVEALNQALAPLGLDPNHPAGEARARGRYVLEGYDRVDVVISRAIPLPEAPLPFEDAWQRRRELPYAEGITIAVPTIDDLIKTKRSASRPKDLQDIVRLEALKAGRTDDDA